VTAAVRSPELATVWRISWLVHPVAADEATRLTTEVAI
jgi:hypothetical protein